LLIFKISRILLFRLLDARELLIIKQKNNVLKIGFFNSKNKNNLSINQPDIPLNDKTINVIIAPPIYNFDLFPFAILSANLFKKIITTPMNWTGCGKLFGSPIKRSRRIAAKIK